MYQHIVTTLLNLTHRSDIDTKAASIRALSLYYGKDAEQDVLIIEQLAKLAQHPNTVVEIAALEGLYTIALQLDKPQRKSLYHRTHYLRWQDYLRYQRQVSRAHRTVRRAWTQLQNPSVTP